MHITTGHPEVADYLYEILATIENPDVIYEGNENGLIAAKSFPELNAKFVVVIYKEVSASDGFVINAFLSSKKQEFEKKKYYGNSWLKRIFLSSAVPAAA